MLQALRAPSFTTDLTLLPWCCSRTNPHHGATEWPTVLGALCRARRLASGTKAALSFLAWALRVPFVTHTTIIISSNIQKNTITSGAIINISIIIVITSINVKFAFIITVVFATFPHHVASSHSS